MLPKIHQALEHAKEMDYRRREEKLAVAKMLATATDVVPRPPATAIDQRVVEFVGLDLAKLRENHAKRKERLSSLLRRVPQAEPRKRRRPHPREPVPPPATDDPPQPPVCFFPASDCSSYVGSNNSSFLPPEATCDASKALLQLSSASDSLGGWLGIEAFPSIVPVSGSLWYSFMPPASGTIAVVAEIYVTGRMLAYCPSWDFLSFLPSIEARAKLTLRLSVMQSGTVQSVPDWVIGDIHVNGGETDGLTFNEDLYAIPIFAYVAAKEPVIVQVSAELYAYGRSYYGIADLDFTRHGDSEVSDDGTELPHDGIEVAVLCVSFTPDRPIQ